ncbi:MAG: tetratricopeptide repeat protein [Burkholderiales bacterium]|nr:MAG: tetratricopeptide repeat protein [Burkholderiales bacterium]
MPADGSPPAGGVADAAPGGGTSGGAEARPRGELVQVPADGQDANAAQARHASPDAEDEAADGPLPATELTPQIIFQLLAAEVAAQRRQHGAAVATYVSLARRTTDPRLARRATELALAARLLTQAAEAAEVWLELAPASNQAAITAETLWLATGQFDKAEPMLAQRLERARGDGRLPAAYARLQRALAQASDPAVALALLERLSEPDLELAAARMVRASIAHGAGQPDRAVAEAERALALDPGNEAVARALASYARSASEQARGNALGLLDAFLERNPTEVQVRYAYAQLLGIAARKDEARAQFEHILAENPDDPSTLLSLSQLAYEAKQPAEAERYLKRYVALPDALADRKEAAFLFLGQIAEDSERPDQALEWYRRVGPGEQYVNAVVRRAMIQAKQGQVEEARTLLKSVEPRSDRERSRLISAEAQLLREARRYEDSFDVLDAALAQWPDDPDLLYDHGLAAERLKRLDAMERSLRRLMELRPDQAHAFNALGYSLADRNVRLDEALALIEKAHQISPDDPFILDSLGWVHFRLGNLERAVDYLKQAYAKRPDTEIAVHLGEVLWVMGQAEEAMQLWRAARSKEPNNETLRATLARLNIEL